MIIAKNGIYFFIILLSIRLLTIREEKEKWKQILAEYKPS